MSKLVLLALLVVMCGAVAVYGVFDTLGYPQMDRVAKVVCGPHLSADKKRIVNECNKLIPSFARSAVSSCVRSVLKVNKMTKPAICYRTGPGGDKLKPCLLNRAKASAKRLPPGVDPQAMRKQLAEEYQACMIKVL
ncbi:unnamed protein product [Medioppia subpectinata]|uniref:Uncharacterized protein n=1 Tax=Medioppia subpectinata TaxID=1979941 RepID=A0A7R9KYY7_9ACAR|nr:unnamed protein product [Medioppia subpectinata]CAG2112231.1 unnamed protein product [Medioppia subpectinata]